MVRTRKQVNLALGSATDLFSSEEERSTVESVREIAVADIYPFANHPFHVQDDEEMAKLIESVQAVGILVPIQVRVKGKRYELISGHRRKHAAERAGLKTIPAIVRELDDDEAIIAMVDSNLQRERILPSERAFAYRMKLDAMKRQGRRTDLTSTPEERKSRPKTTVDLIAQEAGESSSQVQRYVRLTYLIKELLDLVDEGTISLRPAVELSYLTETEQRLLHFEIGAQLTTPSHAQTIKLKRYSREGKLDAAVIQSIMEEAKPNQVEQFKMSRDKLAKYFRADASPKAIEQRIIKALDLLEKYERIEVIKQ